MDRFTIGLLGTILATLVAAEVICAVGFERSSSNQRRESRQRSELLTVRDPEVGSPPHVAVLGNSLMLEGVDVPTLTTLVGSHVVPAPYFVLATEYYDWYFALKRLFADGFRPRFLVLGLSPHQLSSPRSRGDYSARYLFRGSDLIDVIHATHMDANAAASLFLAHISEYWGTRSIIRGYVMGLVLPSAGQLLRDRVSVGQTADIDEVKLEHISAERLKSLDQLCREHGVDFTLIVPPTSQNGAEVIVRTGRELGVRVIVPVSTGALNEEHYQNDRFHLNKRGAKIFTTQLGSALIELVSNAAPTGRSTQPTGAR
jgi:hypothetical protein